ncbi:DapH/DapD/GlmU-related protein [Streptomyces albidoflavus]
MNVASSAGQAVNVVVGCGVGPPSRFRDGAGVPVHHRGPPCATARRAVPRPEAGTPPITVGEDAYLGARVTVLPGVTIGAGAAVGAGSVVTGTYRPRPSWRATRPG